MLFVGGSWPHLSSVSIRCIDIARRIGCKYVVNVKQISDIPSGFDLYFCVKPKLKEHEMRVLRSRGIVIWDIIDRAPPPIQYVHLYIASTRFIAGIYSKYNPVMIVPHYHCNFSGTPNPPNLRRPGWVGSSRWYPPTLDFDHEIYDVRGMTRCDIEVAYRTIGIGLNLRTCVDEAYIHSLYSSGVKLINCIGFGIPSVSTDELAYREFGDACTLFTSLKNARKTVEYLQGNPEAYESLRHQCIRSADQFHIDTIMQKYRNIIASF